MPKVLPQYTDDAKRRIVQAAIEALAECGYDVVAINTIARKIGVTKGAVYWYFPSKNALMQEVLITIENELEKIRSDPFFSRFDTCNLPEAFDRFFSQKEKRRELLVAVGILANPDAELVPMTPRVVGRLITTLEHAIEIEQKNGQFPSLDDRKTLATALAAICSGMLMGDFYPMVFLGRERFQRVWFFSVKHFLQS